MGFSAGQGDGSQHYPGAQFNGILKILMKILENFPSNRKKWVWTCLLFKFAFVRIFRVFLWCYWIGSQIRDHQPHSVHICLFVMPHGQKGRRFTEYCTWYSSSNWLRPFLFASLSSDQECMLLGTVGYRKHLKSMTLSVCPLCPCRCHPLKSLSQWLAENIWSIMDTIIQRFCA